MCAVFENRFPFHLDFLVLLYSFVPYSSCDIISVNRYIGFNKLIRSLLSKSLDDSFDRACDFDVFTDFSGCARHMLSAIVTVCFKDGLTRFSTLFI